MKLPTRETDIELVDAMAAGDGDRALAELFARHGAHVFALVARIVGPRAEAEEIFQQVFLELWRRAGNFQADRGSVRAWVTSVARSRAIDALRARKRRRADTVVPFEEAVLPAPAPLRPDAQAAAREEQLAVRRALARIGPDQRRAITLSYFEGLSHAEIAARLRIPVGTVKSRIAGAVRNLRAELQAGWSAGERQERSAA
jgi:RNA polymerase sigma-70 factor, ECF subfamily